MTRNRELFVKDPLETTIPNLGVTKVLQPQKPEEWEVLRYELTSFVCDGEYHAGLERILSTFLEYLDKPSQPAVWVSGFYGSGKSHLVRVLEHLWSDTVFPDGATARGLVHLPDDIRALLTELATAGRRNGGLWSAAGMLATGAGGNVRLAFLGILFQGAGLPTHYAPARFALWLMGEGLYDAVKARVEEQGRDFAHELSNLYVSPALMESLLAVYPDFAPNPQEGRKILREQFPNRTDVSDDEVIATVEEILTLQSTTPGKLPCTLLVLDELQQFIGDDPERALQVQSIVENCSSRFHSRILLVATGQEDLGSSPQLQKLQGRFTVRVRLSETDVDRVVREVVLRKRADMVPTLKATLERVSGEIDRHLAGTKIGATQADGHDLIADYPLLPVRRRFWERVLRAVDTAGKAGQLRTQLMLIHEANRQVAEKPVGCVIPGDAIYPQLAPDMLQSGILQRELHELIHGAGAKTPEDQLRSRILSLAFLIGKLPTDGPLAAGVKATAETFADLLVDDLNAGSADLRRKIPELLERLVEDGTLMHVDGEYRLQTAEAREWDQDFRARVSRILNDPQKIAELRTRRLQEAIEQIRKGIRPTHGQSRTPREVRVHYGLERPDTNDQRLPIWVRDGWSVQERAVEEEARQAGPESPIVFVFLPRVEAENLRQTLARAAAAQECLDTRPEPTTPGGIEAKAAMRSRLVQERNRVQELIGRILTEARVFLGGGSEVSEGTLAASLEAAVDAALDRLFPKFSLADHSGWDAVLRRAQQGAPAPLQALGYSGEPGEHPVCRAILSYLGPSGKKGREIRAHFVAPPYGWPQDAIDGALLALVQAGLVRAERNGQPLTAQMNRNDISGADFSSETVVVTASDRLRVRQLLQDVGLAAQQGQEASKIPDLLQRLLECAERAGGDPPLPLRPSVDHVRELRQLAGNRQVKAVADSHQRLLDDYRAWSAVAGRIAERLPRWEQLVRLLHHAQGLPVGAEVSSQVEAIQKNRALLDDPDPVSPLLDRLTEELRGAVRQCHERLVAARQQARAELEATDGWAQLSEAERQRLLAQAGLSVEPTVDLGTPEALLGALDQTPLRAWEDKIAAVDGRLAHARQEVARLLEPQAVSVRPRRATLRSEAEVDDYLASLRSELLEHVRAGRPVIVG